MSDRGLIVSFSVCLCSAIALTVLHFQMKPRLEAARLPVKWFMTPRDDFRMWRMYRQEAPSRQWPIWPFFAYKILQVLFALSAVLVMFNGDRLIKLVSFRLVLGHMDWIIAWSYFTSLAVAVVFTVRVISKVPMNQGKPMWKTLLRNEYARSDLYAAILGWSGLPVIYFSAPFLSHMANH